MIFQYLGYQGHPLLRAIGILPVLLLAIQINTPFSTSLAAEPDSTPVYITFDEKSFATLKALPQDQPLDLLNMIRFRDVAQYPDGSEFAGQGWSGVEAYSEYSRRIAPLVDPNSRESAYGAMPLLTIVGPDHEQWDRVFVVRWASTAAFLNLIESEEYQRASVHRTAAVADSRAIGLLPPR